MEKILIIEDDKQYTDNLSILLKEEGYQILTASNGFDGIDSAKNNNPDLIICDIMLPDIDGYTILKELRRREKTKIIPLIFLTAKAEMSDIRSGMNLGADDYVTKPFRANDLITAVRIRLEKANLIKELSVKRDYPAAKARLEPDNYIFLPSKNNYETFQVSSVVCISSEGVYSNVFKTNGKKILVRRLLKEWEETLPDKLFVRIHKTSLINLKYVKKIEKWFNGSLRVYLEHYDDPLVVSRRYAVRLKKKI